MAPPKWFLVVFAGGRRGIVWVTEKRDGQVLIRLEFPAPNPKKDA